MEQSSRSPLHAELRARTAELHRDLERRVDLVGASLSLGRYRFVVETFYGYYVPLEAGVAAPLERAPVPPPSFRPRASLLAGDLRALGLSDGAVAGLPRCAELPP